jgi:2-polyprenyl-3-methyl-5-hydroxy-6-metoxy-1,4-benzoquinol methylase
MLNDEVRAIWNANAEFWDSRMGEGNSFHKTLIEPTQLRLLEIQPGQRILDVACGNAQFSRKMASLGARVTAVDFADTFISIAKAKSDASISFSVVDACNDSELGGLATHDWDAVVCTMALMDMEAIVPLARRLPEILKQGGSFVFSVMHPCFNSGEVILCHERFDAGDDVKDVYSVKISNHLVEKPSLGIGMVGQPRPQYYFHRPTSELLRPFLQAGLVLDAIEEPSFKDLDSTRIFDNVFKNIPAALVCRLRNR